jgi:hypothetical protein
MVFVFNTTLNNILVISWTSVLLVEETRVPGENYWPALFQWKTLSHIGVSSTPCYEQYKLCTTFNKIVMCMREPVLFSNNKWILLVFCMFNHICCLLSSCWILMIICGLFEPKQISAGLLLFVYICIAVGDPIIKSGGLGSHKPV